LFLRIPFGKMINAGRAAADDLTRAFWYMLFQYPVAAIVQRTRTDNGDTHLFNLRSCQATPAGPRRSS
jgi:hypothetical protein